MATSAIDCLASGVANATANWELALVKWGQIVVVTLLTILGALPLVALVGWNTIAALSEPSMESVEDFLEQLLLAAGEQRMALAVGLLVATVVWMLALLIYCWSQAGIFRILTLGDRSGPSSHRSFGWRRLSEESGAAMWQYFWYLHWVAAMFLALVAALGLALAAAVWGSLKWGGVAGAGIGCATLLPVMVAMVLMVLWSFVGQALLGQPGASVRAASRVAARVVAQHPVFLLGLAVLAMLLSVLITAICEPLSALVTRLFEHSLVWRATLRVFFLCAQWLLQGGLAIALGGTLVALVRDDLPMAPRAPRAPVEATV